MHPYGRVWMPAVLFSGILGVSGTLAQNPKPQASPDVVFPVGVEQVTVDVLVLDGRGQPVEGLTAADFTVTEDDKPQAVTSFEAIRLEESAPTAPAAASRVSSNTVPATRPERSFVVVFDDAHLSPVDADRARKAVAEFLTSSLQAGDQVTVVPTAGGSWWTARLPEGAEGLRRFLDHLRGLRQPDHSSARISDYEAMRIVQRDAAVLGVVARRYFENGLLLDPPNRESAQNIRDLAISPGLMIIQAKASEVYRDALQRNRQALRTLERVLESLAEGKGRKSVLLVSQGFVHDPTVTELKDVVRAARGANAAVYFLDGGTFAVVPGGGAEVGRVIEERDALALQAQEQLEAEGAVSIALDTGGSTFRNPHDLAEGMARISRESRAYYLLGYNPTNTRRDGKYRKIRVAVKRPGLEARARKGYYAPGEGGPRREPGELDPALRSALDAPFDNGGVPLRMTSYVFGAAADGRATVLLVAEADPRGFAFEDRNGRFEDDLDTYVVVTSRETGEIFRQERRMSLSLPAEVKAALERSWVPIQRSFELPPGTYQARLLAREWNGRRAGTVRLEFTVPLADGLRTSTPILTDTAQADPAGGPPRPVPTARRTFSPGAQLQYVFDVYGADRRQGAPRVTVEYLVRREDGSTFAKAEPRPLSPGPDGALSHRLVLGLQAATPGGYEIVLTVRDEAAGKTVEWRDPFAVGAVPASFIHTRPPPAASPVCAGGTAGPKRTGSSSARRGIAPPRCCRGAASGSSGPRTPFLRLSMSFLSCGFTGKPAFSARLTACSASSSRPVSM